MPKSKAQPATKADLLKVESRLGGRINGLETRLDSRMISLETRLNGRINTLETRLDGRMDRLEERFAEYRDEVLIALDKQMVILQRLDQERVFTIEWVKRLEGEIEKIKRHVGLTS